MYGSEETLLFSPVQPSAQCKETAAGNWGVLDLTHDIIDLVIQNGKVDNFGWKTPDLNGSHNYDNLILELRFLFANNQISIFPCTKTINNDTIHVIANAF